ncbi:MAG: aldo/keto reductase [Bacteroidia bacterium]
MSYGRISPAFKKDIYRQSSHFSNGSRLVCGTSGLGGVWGEIDESESVDVILYMLESGINSLDTAPSYHLAEKILGNALRQWEGEVFVSTKVGRLPAKRADECYVDYSPKAMRESLLRSLDLLGQTKASLLFLHEPHLVPTDKIEEILETLSGFRDEGLTDLLGVGGNPGERFMPHLTRQNFDVLSGFLGLDACNLSAMKTYIPRLKEENIALYAASALHMGLLGERFEEYCQNRPDNEWITHRDVDTAIAVKRLADREGIALPELALRYLFSIEEADRVVVGPTNMAQAKSIVNFWKRGGLEASLFDEISAAILSQNSR